MPTLILNRRSVRLKAGRSDTLRYDDMTKFFHDFVRNETGAAAAEYALILAIVGTGIALAAFNLGGAISGAMNKAKNCITSGNGAC